MTADIHAALEKELGPGPMRFAHKGERSTADQMASLSADEKKCVDELKAKWEKQHPDKPFGDDMYLRFARCSPGKKKFHTNASWKVMKKFNAKYLTLKAESIEEQLMSKTLFPVPGLKTKEGSHSVFYMRPSRYFPSKTTTEEITDNLAYCMNTMCEAEKEGSEGIGFMAYMSDFRMTNFSVNYCYQFMMLLQGRIPVRVRLFLIVNPPGWFGKIWNIMKPMLAADFRKKVHVIQEVDLPKFLEDGFETYLPDETDQGKADTQGMVEDFVTYRKRVE